MTSPGILKLFLSWLTRRQRLLTALLLTTIFFGNQGFRRLVNHWLELRRLRQEIVALQDEEKRVDKELKLLQSSHAPLERMARKDLGFIKPGEIEYRFPPPGK